MVSDLFEVDILSILIDPQQVPSHILAKMLNADMRTLRQYLDHPVETGNVSDIDFSLFANNISEGLHRDPRESRFIKHVRDFT